MAINCVVLLGRLVADPVLRQTQNGTNVTSFTLAVDRPKSADGDSQADFIDCTAWRGTAELICKYFSKGRTLAVEGSMRVNTTTNERGEKRRRTEVVVSRISFVGDTAKNATESRKSTSDAMFEEIDLDDGELPF